MKDCSKCSELSGCKGVWKEECKGPHLETRDETNKEQNMDEFLDELSKSPNVFIYDNLEDLAMGIEALAKEKNKNGNK